MVGGFTLSSSRGIIGLRMIHTIDNNVIPMQCGRLLACRSISIEYAQVMIIIDSWYVGCSIFCSVLHGTEAIFVRPVTFYAPPLIGIM